LADASLIEQIGDDVVEMLEMLEMLGSTSITITLDDAFAVGCTTIAEVCNSIQFKHYC
jgi:hypothetical protein